MVTPVGNDTASTWANLRAGKSGVDEIRYFDASGFPVRIGAEVKNFELPAVLAKTKRLKFASRSHRFALAAAEEALNDAGIRPQPENAERWGLSVGAGMMAVSFPELEVVRQHCTDAGWRFPTGRFSQSRFPDRSGFLLPHPDQCRPGLAHPAFRDARLRHCRSYRVRLRRPGARHGPQSNATRDRWISCWRAVLIQCSIHLALPRFVCSARSRPTTTRPKERVDRSTPRAMVSCLVKARAFCAGRLAGRGEARSKDLCRARRRRKFAEQLPHHRFSAGWRRADSVDLSGVGGCRHRAGRSGLSQRARHLHADE